MNLGQLESTTIESYFQRVIEFLTVITQSATVYLMLDGEERVKIEASLVTILSLSQLKYHNLSVEIKKKILLLVRNVITLRSQRGQR